MVTPNACFFLLKMITNIVVFDVSKHEIMNPKIYVTQSFDSKKRANVCLFKTRVSTEFYPVIIISSVIKLHNNIQL